MIVPSDHQAIVDELERLEAEFRRLAGPMSDEELNRPPVGRPGWSVAQCIEHLTLTNALYLPALAAAAAKGRAAGRGRRDALRPNLLGRWLIRELEPPPKRRVRAPLAGMEPSPRLDKESLLSGFAARQAEMIELLRETSDLDLTGIRFRNPLAKNLPVFNLAAGFLIVAAHERRHLWQAQRVGRAAAEP
ncbi:MAG: DinB family protein [Thermoanaerobaculia bacterium]